MKKMMIWLLSVLLVVTCCVPVSGVGYNREMTLSLSDVYGKSGEIVFVTLSLDTPNTGIGAMGIEFMYDTNKMELVVHPESEEGECCIPGDLLKAPSVLYTFGEEDFKTAIVSEKGLWDAGDLFSFSFRLKEDVLEPISLVSCKVFDLTHCNGYQRVYTVTYNNNCEYLRYSPADKDAMFKNQVSFDLDSVTINKREPVSLNFTLNESYTYMKEFAVQFSFDSALLKVVDFKMGEVLEQTGVNASFDSTTATLTVKAEKTGLTKKGVVGTLVLDVIAQPLPLDAMRVDYTFVQPPVHDLDPEFEYEITQTFGSVLLLFQEVTYEAREEGLFLVKYVGNQSQLLVPTFYEGEPVVGIGENAFVNSKGLKLLTLTNYIQHLSPNSFEGCSSKMVIRCVQNGMVAQFAEGKFPLQFYAVAENVTDTDVFVKGDLNDDTVVNAKDALIVLRIAVEKVIPNFIQETIGDVNADDRIDAKDALEILKKAVDKPACF